jgi:RNA polymerase sigma factor (sigma-70 family)
MLGDGCPKYLISDKACVLRVQKGEFDTLRVLYEKYYADVLQYICARITEPSDAMDITSQVFTKVIDNIDALGPPYDFKNWLYTIVNNQVRSYYRKQKSNKVDIEADIISEQPDSETSLLENIGCKTPSQETLNIRYLKNKLQLIEQNVLHLKYAVGLTFAEIGKATGKSEAAVIKIYIRTKKKLEKLYLQNYKSPVYSGGEKNEEEKADTTN